MGEKHNKLNLSSFSVACIFMIQRLITLNCTVNQEAHFWGKLILPFLSVVNYLWLSYRFECPIDTGMSPGVGIVQLLLRQAYYGDFTDFLDNKLLQTFWLPALWRFERSLRFSSCWKYTHSCVIEHGEIKLLWT